MWQRLRYSLYAPLYDRAVRRFEEARQNSIRGAHLQAGQRVLLVGAGTGLDLEYLPADSTITATDINPTMLRYLQRRATGLPLTVTTSVMDGRRLALPASAYDVVILHLVLAVMPDPELGIQEAVRVLKPGGTLIIFDKFLPSTDRPSRLRQLANNVIATLATDINRRVEPLLALVPVKVTYDVVALRVAGVVYRILYATKQP